MTDGESAEGNDVAAAGGTEAMGDPPTPDEPGAAPDELGAAPDELVAAPDEPGAAPDEHGSRRGAAVCVACGAAYAVERCADGRVIPIGSRTGCRCGSDQFRLL